MIPAILLVMVMCIFLFWQLEPKKKLNIALVDKTVPAADMSSTNDESTYYRKHLGFYWLLEQQKYVKSDKSYYDYKTDYFGPQLNDAYEVSANKPLTELDYQPDLLYVSDLYGSELYKNEYAGLKQEDMGVISYAKSCGATIVAEMETMNACENDSVRNEIQSLCGIQSTSWIGRYIFELQDMTDVPEWAPPLYKQISGVEWKFRGPGLLLVSSKGDLIILEEKTDFNSKNLMTISINDDYKKEFRSARKCNFYNWFELILADSKTEVLASFDLNLNATGMEKIAKISSTSTFAAATRSIQDTGNPVYYFAGDFNDYVTSEKFGRFLFADTLYRAISYEHDGDVTNFYWNFYNPMMKKILKDTYKDAKQYQTDEETEKLTETTRIRGNSFEISSGGEWEKFDVKGFSINGCAPGGQPYQYSNDYAFYAQLIELAVSSGANTLRTYDLLPPEFYRAVYDNNHKQGATPVYIVQGIVPPSDLSVSDFTTEAGLRTLNANIEDTVRAVHGEGAVKQQGARAGASYFHDLSKYVLAYVISSGMDTADDLPASAYRYTGTYCAAENNAAEAVMAQQADFLYAYLMEQYGYLIPVGMGGNAGLLTDAPWNEGTAQTYNFSNISVSKELNQYFFTSYALMPGDYTLLNNPTLFSDYEDNQGAFPYGGYVRVVKELQNGCPMLVDKTGLSTNMNLYEKETAVNGLSETQQGQGIVRMLKAIDKEGCLGGLVGDLNDTWSTVSPDYYPYTVSLKNNPLWQNLADPTQTSGVVAVEPEKIDENDIGLEMNDSGRMKQIKIAENEGYIYITMTLDKEINYDNEELFIGLDTYQRSAGEYLYSDQYFSNSLSGMEFMIRFESKTAAGLYVNPSYNASKGRYESQESYTGKWDLVSPLKYGSFNESNTNFFQTGTTVSLRIPWAAIGFTDPSQKVVISDAAPTAGEQVKTTVTNGIIFSVSISEKTTRDTVYLFPESKESTGYKTFKWSDWETAGYTIRAKKSLEIIAEYFK